MGIERYYGDIIYDMNTVRLAIVLGIIVGFIIFERFNLRSGGYVSGGYIALFLRHPLNLAAQLLVAFLTYFIVMHVLVRFVVIFGRRKFAFMCLVALLLGWVLEYALKYTLTPLFTFTVIGHIIPALIANDFEIQGIRKTLLGLFIVILSVFGMLNLIMFI